MAVLGLSCSMWDLVPRSGIKDGPTLGAYSLSHLKGNPRKQFSTSSPSRAHNIFFSFKKKITHASNGKIHKENNELSITLPFLRIITINILVHSFSIFSYIWISIHVLTFEKQIIPIIYSFVSCFFHSCPKYFLISLIFCICLWTHFWFCPKHTFQETKFFVSNNQIQVKSHGTSPKSYYPY